MSRRRMVSREPAGYVTLESGQRLAIHDRKIAGVMRWYADNLEDAEQAAQSEREVRVRYQRHWWVRLGWWLRLCRPNATRTPSSMKVTPQSAPAPSTNGDSA